MVHKAERRSLINKTVKETEAESVAFVVAKAIGLEPGSASAELQLYRGDAKLLQESLEVVQRTATVILGAITPEVAGRAGSEDNNQEVQHWKSYRGEYSSTFAFLMEFDTAIKGPEELSVSYR